MNKKYLKNIYNLLYIRILYISVKLIFSLLSNNKQLSVINS